MKKAGCNACHTVDKKGVGPAYKDVAAKNKGKADAAQATFDKVRKGGAGVYGQVPMPPNAAGQDQRRGSQGPGRLDPDEVGIPSRAEGARV